MSAVGIAEIATCFAAGGVVAVAYLAALWATVRRIPTAPYPGMLLGVSAVVRIGAATAAFYWIMDGSVGRLAALLLGFVAARTAAVRAVSHTTSSAAEPGAGG